MMPANNHSSMYDQEPLLNSDDSDNFSWKCEYNTDRNGNRVYEPEKPGYIPGSGIQLHPKFIESESSPNLSTINKIYPKERKKALFGFLLLVLGFLCNSVSIVLTHQKVPDRNLHPPLPDISLDNFTKHRWLNDFADILVIICATSSALLIIYHRHRWILCRRIFLIMSMLYGMRSFTMYVTVLPVANSHSICSPKINSTLSYGQTVLSVTEEVLKLLLAGGLPITGRKTMCGDYIFSGHTIIFMLTYLLVREYTPRRYKCLHWSTWITAWFGMLCLLISHGHYTIDVIISYYATTRMFWIYHTFANHPELSSKTSKNSLSEVWWFKIFQYFEGNIIGPLPYEYSIPRIRRRQVFPVRKEFFE